MPVYEFYCRACEKTFVTAMHVAEHEADVPECPSCHRKDRVDKRMSSFTAMTSHKSAAP